MKNAQSGENFKKMITKQEIVPKKMIKFKRNQSISGNLNSASVPIFLIKVSILY